MDDFRVGNITGFIKNKPADVEFQNRVFNERFRFFNCTED